MPAVLPTTPDSLAGKHGSMQHSMSTPTFPLLYHGENPLFSKSFSSTTAEVPSMGGPSKVSASALRFIFSSALVFFLVHSLLVLSHLTYQCRLLSYLMSVAVEYERNWNAQSL